MKNKLLLIAMLFQFAFAKSQCCNYTLSMHDSYGDGWNGGYLEVFINNTSIGTYSGLNYASTATFQVCDGDSLKLIYTAGAYENENTYQLFDAAWNNIFVNGPNPTVGVALATTGNCSSLSNPGNHPCTAIPIDTTQCLIYDNTGFPNSGIVAGCANFQGHDMWFQTIVPPSGNILIATDSGSLGDTGMAIWTDTSCTNVHTSIACDDDSGIGYFSEISLYNLIPGQQIFIQIWGYGGATGTFQLCVHNLQKVVLDSTELPLVMINTLGNPVVQNVKSDAMMYIKYNGAGTFTHINDSANVYSGHIGIAVHGASSAGYPQIPYSIETRTDSATSINVQILGMPAESDWILISNYNDRSFIRNTLATKIFREAGNYSTRQQLCEVFVDSAYQGVYVFSEKIKRDSGRVNIGKMNSFSNFGDALTGGYILQQNIWDASNSFQSNYSPIDHPGFDVHYLYEYPSVDSITPIQKTFIASYVDSLEGALYSANFTDTSTGYRKFMDVKSFIDYFIVNELSRNADGFKKSIFYNKDKHSNGNDKLKMGPVWDFDWAWKDLGGCSIYQNQNGSGWAHHNNDCGTDVYSNGYFVRLFQDTTFCNQLRCTWENYRQTILDTSYLFGYIDSIRNLVQHAQARHFQMWHTLGTSGPAPEIGNIATTYNAEMDTMKAWITRRLIWLDDSIPGHCYQVDHSGIMESSSSNLLHYYPNPSNGTIHFEGTINSSSPLQLHIYDLVGKLVNRVALQSGAVKFNYQLNKKGVYYFTISNNKEILQHGKLIIL